MNSFQVILSQRALKEIRKIPKNIVLKLMLWVKHIETIGSIETRKIKGYHDEPLKGNRKGERSVRLNKAYRAIYQEYQNKGVELSTIELKEVNKHEY